MVSDNKNSNKLWWEMMVTVTISSATILQITETVAVRSDYDTVSKCHKAINSDITWQVTVTVSASTDDV